MRNHNVHVVPHGDDWAVRHEDADDMTLFPTQQEAVDEGRKMAKAEHVEFILHGQDGAIRLRDSYGHDPRDVPG